MQNQLAQIHRRNLILDQAIQISPDYSYLIVDHRFNFQFDHHTGGWFPDFKRHFLVPCLDIGEAYIEDLFRKITSSTMTDDDDEITSAMILLDQNQQPLAFLVYTEIPPDSRGPLMRLLKNTKFTNAEPNQENDNQENDDDQENDDQFIFIDLLCATPGTGNIAFQLFLQHVFCGRALLLKSVAGGLPFWSKFSFTPWITPPAPDRLSRTFDQVIRQYQAGAMTRQEEQQLTTLYLNLLNASSIQARTAAGGLGGPFGNPNDGFLMYLLVNRPC